MKNRLTELVNRLDFNLFADLSFKQWMIVYKKSDSNDIISAHAFEMLNELASTPEEWFALFINKYYRQWRYDYAAEKLLNHPDLDKIDLAFSFADWKEKFLYYNEVRHDHIKSLGIEQSLYAMPGGHCFDEYNGLNSSELFVLHMLKRTAQTFDDWKDVFDMVSVHIDHAEYALHQMKNLSSSRKEKAIIRDADEQLVNLREMFNPSK